MMVRTRKNRMIVFLLIAVAMIILLAAGLSSITLHHGEDFSWFTFSPPQEQVSDQGPVLPVEPETSAGPGIGGWELVIIIAVLALVPLSIVYYLLSADARRTLARVVNFIVGLSILLWAVHSFIDQVVVEMIGVSPIAPASGAPLPDGVEISVESATWVVYAVSIGLFLVLAASGWFVWYRFFRKDKRLQKLAQQAEETLQELRAGADLRDAVTRCYYDMSQALSETKGIKRQKAVTPREFEGQLRQAGLPAEDVRRLTRLFERVRYGAKTPGRTEEIQAIACLTAIVDACAGAP
jgi:hypothetical protein